MTIQEALEKDRIWAVLGATPREEKFGYKLYKRLKNRGYEVYPIHPKADTIDGDKCYRTLSDLPTIPHVVDVVVPEEVGIRAMAECKSLGISTVWLQPGADTPAVIEAAKQNGLEIITDCVLVQLP